MELNLTSSIVTTPLDVDLVASSIASLQKEDGEIPWHLGGKTDPWDHVESAMGLSIGGYLKEAELAYEWMARKQLEDGSWYSSYRDGKVEDFTRETNMSSYIAVGVFHHYLVTKDLTFVRDMWPTVSSGLDYAVALQADEGEIYWARDCSGRIDPMALLTGCSSIYMSLKCGLEIASLMGIKRPEWEQALRKLGSAIKYKQHLFNMSKARYSMDWYYPVMCGALTGMDAVMRIRRLWENFVVEGLGVRCVSDQPWVTIAETSELTIALASSGLKKKAEKVFSWVLDKRYEDGFYWCGVTFPEGVIWPEEKITWTAAAVLMALDTLYEITPAGSLFKHSFWQSIEDITQERQYNLYLRDREEVSLAPLFLEEIIE